ncbi:hypothetical protein [Chitiniphilus eburneus]|uniref:hypothetical protein n=1 Tax=Chitiniphilus eburneus TaxID=2571148 RepID=UPI0035CED882
MNDTPSPHGFNGVGPFQQVLAQANSRLDSAALGLDYVRKLGTLIATIQQQAGADSPLAGLLDVAVYLAEDGERCLGGELDDAQLTVNRLSVH